MFPSTEYNFSTNFKKYVAHMKWLFLFQSTSNDSETRYYTTLTIAHINIIAISKHGNLRQIHAEVFLSFDEIKLVRLFT